MKVGITGGTGLIGRSLAKKLCQKGEQVIIFSRKNLLPKDLQNLSSIELISNPLPSPEILSNLDAIINLAGESVIGERWTEKRKLELKTSRVNFTQDLVKNIIKSHTKPKVFISASAIGYYGMWEDKDPIFEETSPNGQDFLARLCVEWENAALEAREVTRVVLARIGIVLSTQGGALAQMLPAFKAFVGGPISTGKQYMSWIHIEDITNAFLFLLDRSDLEGPFNLTAPNPVSNEAFSHILAKILNRPNLVKVPSFALTLLYGEGSEVVVKGQNVIPKRLQEAKFSFEFPELSLALKNLLS